MGFSRNPHAKEHPFTIGLILLVRDSFIGHLSLSSQVLHEGTIISERLSEEGSIIVRTPLACSTITSPLFLTSADT